MTENSRHNVYLLFKCSENRVKDSLSLYSAASTISVIKKTLVRAIRYREMFYGYNREANVIEQIQELRNDFRKLDKSPFRMFDVINSKLKNGYIEAVTDGEEY